VTQKTLVTTALEVTWPEDGPLLFLGSWCRSFSRQEFWSSLDYETVPYHWDNRQKLARDYKNLELIYEVFLSKFSEKLNHTHKVTQSERFWRILIGPWLYTFVQVVFDRWYMLNRAVKNREVLRIKIIDGHFSQLVTHDIGSFNDAIETDKWNEALCSLLVTMFLNDKILITYVTKSDVHERHSVENKRHTTLKSMLIKLSNSVSRMFTGDGGVFVIAPHMSFWRQVLLHLKLRQLPTFWFGEPENCSIKDLSPTRDTVTLDCASNIIPDFESVLNAIAYRLMPEIYLEGFQSLLDSSKMQGWPNNPSAIYTCNSYSSNETFKCWAGCQVDAGSKLVIGQHGGNFGMTPMAIHETHQIKISDKWFSWGWEDVSQPKIIPVGNFKSKLTRLKNRSTGDVLLVSMTLSRFSYYLYSVPIAGQVGSYLDDQLDFARTLTDEIRQRLRVRLYPNDRGWDQKARWLSFHEQITFDSNRRSLIHSLRDSRIFVGTYNATTYLETFSANMPSILFWNPNHWEVTAEAGYYFQRLKDVGILHDSPKSAARHLIKIWDSVDEWWFSDLVQEVVLDFSYNYSQNNPQIIDSIVKHLKSD